MLSRKDMIDDKVGVSSLELLVEEHVVAGIMSNICKQNRRKYHRKKKL
jgi:hypothetical protein